MAAHDIEKLRYPGLSPEQIAVRRAQARQASAERAAAKADRLSRQTNAAKEPVATLARALREMGFGEAEAMAPSLWALAQRERQHWADGAKTIGAGPSFLTQAAEGREGASIRGAFARLCLRMGKKIKTDEQERRDGQILAPGAKNLTPFPDVGAPPARLAQAFLTMGFKDQWDGALSVSKQPGFDWLGMVRANEKGDAFAGMMPKTMPAPLDGAMSPIQRFVGRCLRAGATLGASPGGIEQQADAVLARAEFVALASAAWSVALRDELSAQTSQKHEGDPGRERSPRRV
jgi:hypothetical protein